MPKTIKISGDSILLSNQLAKRWQGKQALIDNEGIRIVDEDSPNSLKAILKITKKVGRKITKKDLDEAIKYARQKVYGPKKFLIPMDSLTSQVS